MTAHGARLSSALASAKQPMMATSLHRYIATSAIEIYNCFSQGYDQCSFTNAALIGAARPDQSPCLGSISTQSDWEDPQANVRTSTEKRKTARINAGERANCALQARLVKSGTMIGLGWLMTILSSLYIVQVCVEPLRSSSLSREGAAAIFQIGTVSCY